MDDFLLLARARKGDERAFSELFERHQRRIFRYAVHMCGPQAGDDIVQDTFLAVLRQSGRQDSLTGSVVGYLLGIARHVVLKRIGAPRELQMQVATEIDESIGDEASEDATVLEVMSKEEMVTTVRAAVQTLPPVYREVVVLCELQEMDYEAAAEVIECPVGTVRSRLYRARRLLASKLASIASTQGSAR